MQSVVQALIAHFSSHPEQALAAVFAASLLEAFVVIGTFVPGSTIVFVAGVLIGLGALGLWPTLTVAVFGAILGDGISYWLGRHHHERLRSFWPLRQHPQLLERGQAYFTEHGRASVFLGRFLSPTRAIVPVIAGMSNMPAGPFYLMNVLSALGWAVLHLLPGVLFGASLSLAGAISSRLLVLLVAAVLLLWFLTFLLKFLYRQLWPRIGKLRDRLVGWASARAGLVSRVIVSLLDPQSAESPGLLIAAVVLLGGAWLFLGTLEDVVSRDSLVVFDQAVFTTLQGLRTEWVDRVMVAVTEIGSAAVAIPVIVVAAIVFGVTRCWRTLGYWLGAMVFAQALVWILKATLGRARPTDIYSGFEQFSFPSGHAASSIVLYGFLAFLLARGRSRVTKLVIALAAAVVILLISFSRLYLGAHWFSDVLGSLGFGMTWVALLSIAYTQHVRSERIPVRALSVATLSTMVLAGWLWVGTHHASDVARYAPDRSANEIELPHWLDGGWRKLPAQRTELEGEAREPLSLQWAAPLEELTRVLDAAGWHSPVPWNARTVLTWLLPHPDIAGLPVVPTFNQGISPTRTFVQVLGPERRLVVRLWRSEYVTKVSSEPQRVWMGTVTAETLARVGGFASMVVTATDIAAPVAALAAYLDPSSMRIVVRQKGTSVLLIW